VGNLWAASYPVRKNLVVDVGFEHGLTSTSTQWEVFGGFTYLLPHSAVARETVSYCGSMATFRPRGGRGKRQNHGR